MSKEARAELHERYAGHLEALPGNRASEVGEIAGYHLERAYRYRAELGPLDAAGVALAARAADKLAGAGQRALGRGDLHAAEALLERAISLLGVDDARVPDLVCDLSIVMRDRGLLEEAEASLTGVVERVDADRAVRARAELLRTYVRSLRGAPMRPRSKPSSG